LAQALSPLAPIAPIWNGRQTGGGPLERSNARPSASGHAEGTALEIISGRDRANVIASAESAVGLIRGKWKIAILLAMLDGPIRLGHLRRLIPRASKKVLVQQLHELENDGIIERADLSGKIKHVEYMVSAPFGMAVMNLLGLLSNWGSRHAPAMALHGGKRTGATPVLPMPAKSQNNVQGVLPFRSS